MAGADQTWEGVGIISVTSCNGRYLQEIADLQRALTGATDGTVQLLPHYILGPAQRWSSR